MTYGAAIVLLLIFLVLLKVLAVVWAAGWPEPPRSRGIEIGPHLGEQDRRRLLLASTLHTDTDSNHRR